MFWNGKISLRSRVPDHHADSILNQPMVLAAATSAVKSEPFSHLTNCYSPDYAWAVQMFRDNHDGSFCLFLVSNHENRSVFDPVLLKIEGSDRLIAMDTDHKVVLDADFFEREPDWGNLQVWVIPPVGKVAFEDVHVITSREDHLIIDTCRPRVRYALRRSPRTPLTWVKSDGPGSFTLNLPDWTPDTTVWYYE